RLKLRSDVILIRWYPPCHDRLTALPRGDACGLHGRCDVGRAIIAHRDNLSGRPRVDREESPVELHVLDVRRRRQLPKRVQRHTPHGLWNVHATTLKTTTT